MAKIREVLFLKEVNGVDENKSDNSRGTIRLIIPKSTHHPTNKKAPVRRLFEKPRLLGGADLK